MKYFGTTNENRRSHGALNYVITLALDYPPRVMCYIHLEHIHHTTFLIYTYSFVHDSLLGMIRCDAKGKCDFIFGEL